MCLCVPNVAVAGEAGLADAVGLAATVSQQDIPPVADISEACTRALEIGVGSVGAVSTAEVATTVEAATLTASVTVSVLFAAPLTG